MKEAVGDIWTYPADVRCVCVNWGLLGPGGRAVMHEGTAKQALDRYPGIARRLGYIIQGSPPRVRYLRPDLLAFPTRRSSRTPADLDLIRQSASQLARIANACPSRTFALPRPGCGAGQLSWETVRPMIAPILPDNVVVVHETVSR